MGKNHPSNLMLTFKLLGAHSPTHPKPTQLVRLITNHYAAAVIYQFKHSFFDPHTLVIDAIILCYHKTPEAPETR